VKRDPSVNKGLFNITLACTIIVVLGIIAAFSFQGSRGIYETTEGRYAEAAREMVETGKYLVPTLDYQPHWTKPPLAYWGIATGMLLFGQNEWGVRFMNSLAFFLTTLLVTILGSLLWEKRVGIIAGLIYLSSPFPFFGANALSTDTLLTFWEIFAVLCYIAAYRSDTPKRKSTWVILMWFIFGLGFLTKGPPALLPLIPIVIWNYTRKERAPLFKGFGIPLFIVTGFSWFIVVCIQNPQLVYYFLQTEVVDRVSSTAVHNREWYSPFTIYLPILLAGQGAWLYFSCRGFWRCIRTGPKNVVIFVRKNEEILFAVLWVILPLIIFSISRSRLELYVLPLYGPIALLIARWIYSHESITWKRLVMVGFVSVLILAGFKWGLAHFPNRNNMKQLYAMSLEDENRNADYFVFEEDKLFGMQFYLNGMMQRVTLNGQEPWSDITIEELLTALQGEKASKKYLILSTRKKAPLIEATLRDSDFTIEKTENKYWVWYSISKKNQ
jgi:4-amino-4-deoxy-L-arabinose transferase